MVVLGASVSGGETRPASGRWRVVRPSGQLNLCAMLLFDTFERIKNELSHNHFSGSRDISVGTVTELLGWPPVSAEF